MKVYLISEDNHGQIGVAASRKAALQWVVASGWVTQRSEIWWPDESARWGGREVALEELYGENWKEKFMELSNEMLVNMGFYIYEEEVIEED